MIEALKRYEQGKTVKQIAKATGGALGTVQAWMPEFKRWASPVFPTKGSGAST